MWYFFEQLHVKIDTASSKGGALPQPSHSCPTNRYIILARVQKKKREQPRRFQGQGFLRLLFWQLARHAQNLPATAAAPQPITNRTNSSLWIPCSGKPHLHKPVCHAVHFWIRICRGPEWAAPESKSFSLCCTRSCTRLHHQQIDYSLQKERIKNYFYLEINTSTSLQWRLTNEWTKAKQSLLERAVVGGCDTDSKEQRTQSKMSKISTTGGDSAFSIGRCVVIIAVLLNIVFFF